MSSESLSEKAEKGLGLLYHKLILAGCAVEAVVVERGMDRAQAELSGLLFDEKGNLRTGPLETVISGKKIYTTDAAIDRVDAVVHELKYYIDTCGEHSMMERGEFGVRGAELVEWEKLREALKTNDRDKVRKAAEEIHRY